MVLAKLRQLAGTDRTARSAPKYPGGKRIYCIGDIHGRADLLDEIHDRIVEDAESFQGQKQLLYLGDYIDRGDDSKGVIDRLVDEPLPEFEFIFLIGNHEHAIVNFLEDPETIAGWLAWGGRETLASYGVEASLYPGPSELWRLRDELKRAMPASHAAFYENCRLYHHEGDYYFVHAGIRPGVPLERQDYEDQLWIRDAFTRSAADHGAVVVHGHTISDEPELLPNRIGIDTGAFYSGRLTCLVLEGEERRILQTGVPD